MLMIHNSVRIEDTYAWHLGWNSALKLGATEKYDAPSFSKKNFASAETGRSFFVKIKKLGLLKLGDIHSEFGKSFAFTDVMFVLNFFSSNKGYFVSYSPPGTLFQLLTIVICQTWFTLFSSCFLFTTTRTTVPCSTSVLDVVPQRKLPHTTFCNFFSKHL